MKLPEGVRQVLARRFRNRRGDWLSDAAQGGWPIEIPLGVPTEHAALQQIDGVRAWVRTWQHWQGAGVLSWCERQWKTLGVQRLPEKLTLQGPAEVAAWIGESARWQRARDRHRMLVARWPQLDSRLPGFFDALASYGDADFRRLMEMLAWLVAHPESGLYPRQIPVAGADSKWLESRKGLVADLLAALRGDPAAERDFFARCGLRPPPQLVRMRILDPDLRARVGGLGDISVPCDELAGIALRPATVFIVENLQTGLAFGDLAGAVVVMRLGYAVDVLGRLPWLRQARCIYWGDIDTHGLAILDRARAYVPDLAAVLMDEATLLRHRDLWVEERDPHPGGELPLLAAAERRLYRSLRDNAFGPNVRLEQERIPWDEAWAVIEAGNRPRRSGAEDART